MLEAKYNSRLFINLKLKEIKYKNYLSIEYVHQDYMNTLYEDVLSETIKMRDLINNWKGK